MRESPTEAAVRQFLLSDVLYDRSLNDLAVDEPLLERGFLDSLGILRTVTFCEEHFGVTIPDEEVLPENFENVRAIARLIERCHATRS
jgi:acyl carrier protein